MKSHVLFGLPRDLAKPITCSAALSFAKAVLVRKPDWQRKMGI